MMDCSVVTCKQASENFCGMDWRGGENDEGVLWL